MTMLNDTFERELTLADEAYESGSKTSNLPTPLRWTLRIHHVFSNENISFNPSTPGTTATSQSNCKPVCHWLSFSSSDDEDISAVHSSYHTRTSLPLNSMGFAKPWSKSTYTICDEFKEEISKQLPLLITIGVPIQFQIDVCISMNICNHIPYFLTPVHTWILLQHHTKTHWISVTFPTLRMWWSPPVMKTSLL